MQHAVQSITDGLERPFNRTGINYQQAENAFRLPFAERGIHYSLMGMAVGDHFIESASIFARLCILKMNVDVQWMVIDSNFQIKLK